MDISNLLVPPPIIKTIMPVDQETDIPGEIQIDQSGRLIKTVLEFSGVAGFLIEDYNQWITNLLPRQIGSRFLTLPSGAKVKFDRLFLDKPTMNIGGRNAKMIPQQASDDMLTYSSLMMLDLVNTATGERIEKIPVGYIPVMLGSVLCHLADKTPTERLRMGTCSWDPLGYFIVNGAEKIVMIQEKMRVNRMFVYNKDSQGNLIARMTCSTIHGTEIVNLSLEKDRAIALSLKFFGVDEKKKSRSIGVFQAFRVMAMKYPETMGGLNQPENMLNMVMKFSRPEYRMKIKYVLQPSFLQLARVGDDIEFISALGGITKTSYEMKRNAIFLDLENQLFPHMVGEPVIRKVEMLAMMIAKMAEYMAGFRSLDDRDSWGNKRLETGGRSSAQLFSGVWNKFTGYLNSAIEKKNLLTIEDIRRHITPSLITDEFNTSFGSSNNWGVSGSYSKENIVQDVKQESGISKISQLMRINVQSSRKDKNPKVRMVQNSQLGYICPADTPEGEQCGLVKNMAIGCYLSIERDPTLIRQAIQPFLVEDVTSVYQTKVMLNGKFLGWAIGAELHAFCLQERRSGHFYRDTCIYLNRDNELQLFCDSSRPIRPLLIVDPDGQLVMAKKGLFQAGMDTWLSEGAVEYIDAYEQDGIYLAQSIWMLEDKQTQIRSLSLAIREAETPEQAEDFKASLAEMIQRANYTHCEMDPSAMMSASATIIPLPNHNQAPRNTFQCLDPQELIVMADGQFKAIGDIKDGEEVKTIHPETLQVTTTKVRHHFTIPTDKKVYRVTTVNGRSIVATEDHQFLTVNGWTEVKDLIVGSKVAISHVVSSFDDVPTEKVLITIEDAISYLRSIGTKESLIVKHIDDLKEKNLLPLVSTNKKIPTLARISGLILTDGCLNLYKEGLPQLQGSFGTDEDAEMFESDIESLGFTRNKILDVEGEMTDKETGRVYTQRTKAVSHSGSLPTLLLILGISFGRKTESSSLPLPSWIAEGSKNTKREFLAGFQGGDGCKIRWHPFNKQKGGYFIFPETSQQKSNEHVDSLFSFMRQLEKIVNEVGVETIGVVTSRVSENRNLVSLKLKMTEANIAKYMEIIGYRYGSTKNTQSLILSEYLKYKQIKIDERAEIKKIVNELYEQGYSAPEISKKFGLDCTFVYGLIKGKNSTPRAPRGIISVVEWREMVEAKNNVVYLQVEKIEEVNCPYVSDFETESENHSFLTASGFISHNCNMGRQSLGIYSSAQMTRFDTTAKTLAWPTRPLFETQYNTILGLNDLPSGSMVVVAIMPMGGWGQEDAFIFNQGAIDRGLFTIVKYSSHRSVAKKSKNAEERFARPEVKKNEVSSRYANIDDDGYPIQGRSVRAGDCLIGKIRRNLQTGQVENVSLFATEEGVIDQVLITKSAENLVVRLKVRTVRQPVIGDKFASRSAQKGTIGMILPEEDMPFASNGIKPDIIINPHSIPSRMTMGKVIEIISSKTGALKGERVNATAFRHTNWEDFWLNLDQYGYSTTGKEIMYSGFTGRKMEAQIYIGPCYYQALRHHVLDKIQARSTGNRKPLTHQPIGGRASGGALRVGEMERDAFIAHGASSTLKERLCDVSDRYETVYCRNCGTIAISDVVDNLYSCRSCRVKGDFGRVVIPYIYKLLTQTLAGANLKMSVQFEGKAQLEETELEVVEEPEDEEEDEEGEEDDGRGDDGNRDYD